MPDIIDILLLGLLFLLGCLISSRYGWRPRKQSLPDLASRYQQARIALIGLGIILVSMAIRAYHEQDEPMLNRVGSLALMFLALGSSFFQFHRARKKLRAHPQFARHKSRPVPPFFWQAIFILLPVAGLATFGLYSLRQDRVLAEQDAQAAGQILAQQLAQAVGDETARQLNDYHNACFELDANRSADLGLSSWEGGWRAESNAWHHIRNWQRENPEIDLFAMPPPEANRYWEPRPETMPPQPPDWVGQLNPDQQRLWQTAKESAFADKDASVQQMAIQKFIASKPPDGARANAEYLLLLAKARSLDAPEAAALFADSKLNNSGQVTDAGLPMGQLIRYQRLRSMPDGAGLPGNTLYTLCWAIAYHPSFFSPNLIAEAMRVAKGTVLETNTLTLNAWWQANQAARIVWSDFRRQYPMSAWRTAPFWIDSSIGNFLILLDVPSSPSTNSVAVQELQYSYLLFPKAVVDRAVSQAVIRSKITLPPYALVEFELAGKNLILSRIAPHETAKGSLPLLGQADGIFKNIPFLSYDYPFHIRVSLASPEILYARQSQRNHMFGALILVSAGAALVGLFAAWRAFRRQLQLSEQKSNFVSSVSHELRAPIASVRLMAENLERGKISEPSRQGEYFRFIVQECRRLSSLIENVLDFSRIEQGRKQYEFEPTNLAALVETTVKLMEPYAAEKGVNLRLEALPVQPPACNLEANVDGHAIQQALVNLIDNAVKHSPKGGTVTVGIERRGETRQPVQRSTTNPNPHLALWVEDRGPGIPEAEQEKIFERFYRLGSELRRETQGVGIGLSVVKHIVEAHGGRVVVRSRVGQGSRFTIELPIKNEN